MPLCSLHDPQLVENTVPGPGRKLAIEAVGGELADLGMNGH